MSRGARYALLALLGLLVIIVDQVTKQWIMQSMRLHESIPVIPNLFSLTYIRNPGAAFGLLAGSSNAFRMVFSASHRCLPLCCWARFWSACRKRIG